MLNWMLFCSFVISFAMTIVGLLMDLTYQVQLAPQVESFQSHQLKKLPDYLRLKSKLETHPIFNPKLSGGKNFQNHWDRLTENKKDKRLLSLSEKKVIMAMGKKWLDQKHKIKIPASTIELFQSIYDYSYWETTSGLDAWDASDLIVSSQFFLAHTYHFEPLNNQEALKRVRHLALILLSMENSNLKRTGLSLLEKELTFTMELNEKILDSELLWAPVSLEELKDFRHYLKQTTAMLSYLSSPRVLEEVYLKEGTPTGFCSVMRDKYRKLDWSRKFLQPKFPFEPSFASTINLIEKIKARSQAECLPMKSAQEKEGLWVSHVPYYRRLYAIKMLMSVNRTEAF